MTPLPPSPPRASLPPYLPVKQAHRDLNPDNLLVDDALNLRICDFGLAARISPGTGAKVGDVIQNSVGTVNYIAPEVCRRDAYVVFFI